MRPKGFGIVCTKRGVKVVLIYKKKLHCLGVKSIQGAAACFFLLYDIERAPLYNCVLKCFNFIVLFLRENINQ